MIHLLRSYLTGRTFRICVDSELSTEIAIEAQLGPVLYLVYTLPLYADETAAASELPQIAAIAAAYGGPDITGHGQPPSWKTLTVASEHPQIMAIAVAYGGSDITGYGQPPSWTTLSKKQYLRAQPGT
ncbi:hypothetical protein J6590_070643 [Homalodisca vitripennis]|nr:hypothetical protein J6590_070643 [Homalodisca vitripennis]